jgi:hypothetical protein
MSNDKQIEGNRIEFERNEMSEIIAQSFHPCDMEYDPSDFEWSAHSLQMAGYHKKREGGKYIMLEDIQQFPIRKDHYDKGHGSEHFVFGVESVIEYAENLPTYDIEPKSEWISVDERLPDNYRAVLVVCESTSISGGTLRVIGSYGGGFWSLADADGTHYLTKYMHCIVTHWMELPEPPMMKGAGNENL